MALSRIAQGAAEGLDALERIARTDKSTFADLALVSVLLTAGHGSTLRCLPWFASRTRMKKSPLAPYPGEGDGRQGDGCCPREAYLKSLKRRDLFSSRPGSGGAGY